MVSQVPLANTCRRVALLFEQFGDRDFTRVQPLARTGEENAQIFFVHVHVHASRITAGQQACAGGRAHRASGIKIGKPHPFLRHLVEHRRRMGLRTERTNIGVSKIITEHHDDVGFLRHRKGWWPDYRNG